MKKPLIMLGMAILALGLAGGSPLYAGNITIFDTMTSGAPSTWYNRGNSPGEDQEVEPGCLTDQKWDLEAFVLQGTKLVLIGGYNFRDGVSGFMGGDIFIDVNGDAKYGTSAYGTGGGNNFKNNTFGYDYALVLDVQNNKYDVVKLTPTSTVWTTTVYYKVNDESNPWKYHSGGTAFLDDQSLSFLDDAGSGLTDAEILAAYGVLLTGGYHYVLTVDIGFLSDEVKNALFHYTYQCGNDNLMGRVPIPGSLLLLGSGLVSLLGMHRWKLNWQGQTGAGSVKEKSLG